MRTARSTPVPKSRAGGWTLLEVTIVMTLVILVLGTIASVYPTLTEASVETRLFLSAQIENDKARLQILDDLQTTDSTRSDPQGVPYFQVVDRAPGTANSIVFRKAETFTPNEADDLVSTGFGTSIQYWLNDENRLIRTQDGQSRIIASGIREIRFSKNLQGAVTVEIRTGFPMEGEIRELVTEFQVVPRNVLKM